jgi:alpha-1,4-digalacturonate transport system substrate-binding protein
MARNTSMKRATPPWSATRLKDALTMLVQWHQDGIMPMDVVGWPEPEGKAFGCYRRLHQRAQTPFYLSGSWQVSRLRMKSATNLIGKLCLLPCGPATCTGMPGGGFLAALKYTHIPKRLLALLNSWPLKNLYGMGERTLLFPVHTGIAEKGISFETTY